MLNLPILSQVSRAPSAIFDQQQDQQSKPPPKSENNDAKVTKMSCKSGEKAMWTEDSTSVRNTPPSASAIALLLD
uniref:Uncharacterized protein n=1 Tax=Ditylenchus dipsaci TaxID=166011 RepID=A0A915ECK5_9BILA